MYCKALQREDERDPTTIFAFVYFQIFALVFVFVYLSCIARL